MRTFDVIVIGAGPAGEVAAGRAAEGGLETALVEQELVGGECSFYACMPSKALLRPGELLREVARVPGAREAVTGSLDVTALLRRRDEVIHSFDDSSQLPWIEERGITLVRGRATVTRERAVDIEGGEPLAARRAVVLASGSATLMPPIDGLAEADPWTSRDVTTTHDIPASLAILGGGVVGVEMAQAYATLGTEVTLIEAAERLIAREEPFASEQVAAALSEQGVALRLGAKAERVSRTAGQTSVALADGRIVTGERLLVAIGREPRTGAVEPLGYERGKPVEVDEHNRSKRHDWLYAVGDVNGTAALTHMGKYQARLAIDHLLGRSPKRQTAADGPRSPRVIFSDPQVAAVGHTLASAQEAGLEVRCADVTTSGNAGGSFHGRNAPGTARIVVDRERSVIVGATITGADVAEMLHAFTIAVVAEVPLDRLWLCVPTFPTRSELWLRLLERLGL